jgi:hypothetical protein
MGDAAMGDAAVLSPAAEAVADELQLYGLIMLHAALELACISEQPAAGSSALDAGSMKALQAALSRILPLLQQVAGAVHAVPGGQGTAGGAGQRAELAQAALGLAAQLQLSA